MAVLSARKLSMSLPEDVADLQAVLDQSRYQDVLLEHKAPSQLAARDLFCELPPGKSLCDKHVLCIYDGTQPVGCVELIRGFPEAHVAYLGLLLFMEKFRGCGLGPWALNVVDDICASWRCSHLRLAVIETNLRGLAFWRREGFAELYRKSAPRGLAIVMERSNKSPGGARTQIHE